MTNDAQSERLAVMETKMDEVVRKQIETSKQLDLILNKLDLANADRIILKTDSIILKTELTALIKVVEEMKPDVATVRLAKSFWRVAAWIAAVAVAVSSVLWTVKEYLIGGLR